MILALVSLPEANIWLLHALLCRQNTVLVHLCYKASIKVSSLKFISLQLIFQQKHFNGQSFFLINKFC